VPTEPITTEKIYLPFGFNYGKQRQSFPSSTKQLILRILPTERMENQIFNLSYSEGYNAPTATASFINFTNTANNDLQPERAKMLDFSVHGLLLIPSWIIRFLCSELIILIN
jgi:iron complex outermembrane receptor protein